MKAVGQLLMRCENERSVLDPTARTSHIEVVRALNVRQIDVVEVLRDVWKGRARGREWEGEPLRMQWLCFLAPRGAWTNIYLSAEPI